MTKTQLAVIEWLANENTGGSSETMASLVSEVVKTMFWEDEE